MAERFSFRCQLERFVSGRAALRMILGRYLCVKPEQVDIGYGSFGKPHVLQGNIFFNISHSGGIIALAVAKHTEVGIDVERVRRLDGRANPNRFFSGTERKAFQAAHRCFRSKEFFKIWTRKEAYLKAVGRGIGAPLKKIDVSTEAGHPFRVIDPCRQRFDWFVYDISVGKGYVGALATKGNDNQLRQRLFDIQDII